MTRAVPGWHACAHTIQSMCERAYSCCSRLLAIQTGSEQCCLPVWGMLAPKYPLDVSTELAAAAADCQPYRQDQSSACLPGMHGLSDHLCNALTGLAAAAAESCPRRHHWSLQSLLSDYAAPCLVSCRTGQALKIGLGLHMNRAGKSGSCQGQTTANNHGALAQ